MRLFPVLILLLVAFSACPHLANAQEGLKSIGLRTGFSAKEKNQYFHQYEVFTEYGLPWEWRGDSGWGVGMKVDASAGALHGGHANGFIGTLGPGFSFGQGNRGFAASIGSSLVILNKRHFADHDFAGKLQFLIYLGLDYRFQNGLGLGYRIQHMSNGGIYKSVNPGLDLHMAAVSWNF